MAHHTVAATQPKWHTIDTSEADGGLDAAYKIGPLHQSLVDHLKTAEGVESLDDFTGLFTWGDSEEQRGKRELEFKKAVEDAGIAEKKRLHSKR